MDIHKHVAHKFTENMTQFQYMASFIFISRYAFAYYFRYFHATIAKRGLTAENFTQSFVCIIICSATAEVHTFEKPISKAVRVIC